jgi:hypothetical protein
MLKACLWAVLGKFANDEITKGGAWAIFVLDTRSGIVIRGSQDNETQRSITILSCLIIALLISIGMMMYSLGDKS